jgi:hypothetical protein
LLLLALLATQAVALTRIEAAPDAIPLVVRDGEVQAVVTDRASGADLPGLGRGIVVGREEDPRACIDAERVPYPTGR